MAKDNAAATEEAGEVAVEDAIQETLALLDERLELLDESRKAVQEKLSAKAEHIKAMIDAKRESLHERLEKAISKETDQILLLMNEIESAPVGDVFDDKTTFEYTAKANKLLQNHVFVEVIDVDPKYVGGDPVKLLELKVDVKEVNRGSVLGNPAPALSDILDDLGKAADRYDSERVDAADKIEEKCEALLKDVDSMCSRINDELMSVHTTEDKKLQDFVRSINDRWSKSDNSGALALCHSARAAMVVERGYRLDVLERERLLTRYSLKATKKVWKMEERRATGVKITSVKHGKVYLSFDFFSDEEIKVLKESNAYDSVKFVASIRERGGSKKVKCVFNKNDSSITLESLKVGSRYTVKIKSVDYAFPSKWSEEVEFVVPEFKTWYAWKKCPDVGWDRKYSVDGGNPRVATKVNYYYGCYCTIIGNTHIPLNTVASWNIKILEPEDNDGGCIFIGVAPNDINQNVNNHNRCGWYFDCYDSVLCSGPPHNYSYPGKEYGPRKEKGQYVHTRDSVGVVVDTAKGDLSFVLNGVNLGVAYEGVPLDRPLVPCVLLHNIGDSVELI